MTSEVNGTRHLAQILRDLHKDWQPHDGQAAVLEAIFYGGAPLTFLQCGRKFGKTELQAYVLWRWALTRPGEYYYFCPFQDQAREILWIPGRVKGFGPSKYVEKFNEQQMRVFFRNGSSIRCDGSDNFEKYRGVNPSGIVVDEFKDFRPEWWVAVEPNLATHQAQVVFAGTPPEVQKDQWDKLSDEGRSHKSYFEFPSWINPHIDKDWLTKKRDQLYARGDGEIWEREYGARKIFGGPGALIPMFDRRRHVDPHETILESIRRDRHKLQWYITADPGSASTFAVLFSCVNPLTKDIYNLDCLYETRQSDTSVGKMRERIAQKRYELNPDITTDDWYQTYDEAATWFAMEMAQSFGEQWHPTRKAERTKEYGLSLIKDQFLKGKRHLSDRCEKLAWEIENYVKDKHGKIPKERDHLIDCMRYESQAAGLSLLEEHEPEMTEYQKNRRGYTPDEDFELARRAEGIQDITDWNMPWGLEYD